MKQNLLKNIISNKRAQGGIAALALAVIIGGAAIISGPSEVAELPSFTEPIMEATLQEDETPLAAAPKVTKKTTKKTAKKTVKISKAATKTYTQKLPATTKTTTKNSTSTDKAKNTVTDTKVETTVVTAVTEKYTKKKKTKDVTTTTTTTVTTTVTTKALATPTPVPVQKAASTSTSAYTTTASKLAPKMNQNVVNAYETLGFMITVSPSVNYSGYYNTRDRMITLNARQLEIFPDTVYHELGHFVAFIAGNVDTKADFGAIYAAEKDKVTGVNKAYNTQNASEYFAESVKDYVTNPGALKASRPQTYAAIESAIGKVTDSRVASAKKVYASIWK